MVPSLTGQRPWALSLYSCPLSSPPSRRRSVSNFRAPSRRSLRFAGCKSANAAETSTNSGSAAAVPVASSHCSKASASTRRRWSGPSPPSLPPASSCSGCSSGPPCGAALALPQRPAFEELRQRACAQARELPALGGARVARCLSKTPLKAPGPDGWTALIARALSDEQCHQLADIMRQAELSGSFPAQWAVSLVVLLPKNSEI